MSFIANVINRNRRSGKLAVQIVEMGTDLIETILRFEGPEEDIVRFAEEVERMPTEPDMRLLLSRIQNEMPSSIEYLGYTNEFNRPGRF